jgi:hypothetical protein
MDMKNGNPNWEVGFHEFDTMFQMQGHWQEVNLTLISLVQTLLTPFRMVYCCILILTTLQVQILMNILGYESSYL